MRTKIKFAALVLGAVAGIVCLIYLGPTVLFLLFHSDWQPVDHLLTVQNDTAILRLEVVDGNGAVLWAIENPSEASIASIDYGVLPEGFVQRVPMGHEPRKLAKGKPLGFSYCDSRGGGAFVQSRVKRGGSLQHGLAYWGHREDGVLCDRRFVYDGWTVPSMMDLGS